MKNLTLLFLALLFFSCAKNEIILPDEEPIRMDQSDLIGEITTETGLRSLKYDFKVNGNQDLTWEDFHKNYLTAAEKYKNHEDWNVYISSLILFQMKETSILENINAENYTVLEMYLEELKLLGRAYPKYHYQMLSTVKPFMVKEKIASYALMSYEKGVAQKEKESHRSEDITEEMIAESMAYKMVKEGLEKIYEEDYVIYLPKLQEFF